MVNDVDRKKYGNYLYGGFLVATLLSDGKRFMLVGLTGRQWRSIVNATGIGAEVDSLALSRGVDLGLEGERFKLREKLAALIEPAVCSHTSAEIEAALDDEGACYGPYQSFREMVKQDPDCSPENPLFDD
ncbi:MAG: hypothetical protein U5O39_17625 [Gammaproteobacteria bacterium]|nr:hypothetical protein [Gammaproteobacteria bacterium]